MEQLRTYFEQGLKQRVQALAETKARAEYNEDLHQRFVESDFSQLYGYLTAGMYTEIISADEFWQLCAEVRRWQFS